MAQQDVETMRRAYEAFNRADIPGVLAAHLAMTSGTPGSSIAGR